MGLFSWLLDEVAEVLSDSSSSDFVDPLEQGQQIINNDPVLSGVQETMSRVSEIYEQAMGTSEVPSSNESTRQTISAVMNASPEQLNRMSAQLEGMNAADSIRLSVAEHEADLSARRDVHEAIQDADVAHIRAESAIAEAEQVIDKTNHDLGTAY